MNEVCCCNACDLGWRTVNALFVYKSPLLTVIIRWSNFDYVSSPKRSGTISAGCNVLLSQSYTKLSPARPRMIRLTSRVVHPPASGVPAVNLVITKGKINTVLFKAHSLGPNQGLQFYYELLAVWNLSNRAYLLRLCPGYQGHLACARSRRYWLTLNTQECLLFYA